MIATPPATLEDVKNAGDVVSSAVTAVAIIVGGVWAYWRFARERTRWPRAAVALEFTERRLDARTLLLAVKLRVTNEGRGLMKLTELRFDLHRVRPLDREMRGRIDSTGAYAESGLDADWPLIEQRKRTWDRDERPELEPGESDEYCCDFFLGPSEETVFLYAYLENEKKKRGSRRLGWPATGFYDLQPGHPRGRLASLLHGGGS